MLNSPFQPENGRIVVCELATLVLPGPRACVAPENAGTALDLDKEDSDRRQNKEVHLVDAAVVRDEWGNRWRTNSSNSSSQGNCDWVTVVQ